MQRRTAERTDINIPLQFEIRPGDVVARRASSPSLHKARGVNISPRGLGLLTDCALVKGMVLRLAFPGVDTTMVPIFAEVVWIDPAGSCSMAGARFLLPVTTAISKDRSGKSKPARR